jgi:hypothetical protein
MNSNDAQMEILRDQLNEANAINDFVRGELWSRAQDIWEAHDCLYYAMVLLASCDSCKGESLSWMKGRLQESKRAGELVVALKKRDIRNAQLLADVGIDLATWLPEKHIEASFGDTDDQSPKAPPKSKYKLRRKNANY